jgi:hypothetical protein
MEPEMTTVAIKDGIIAADSAVYDRGTLVGTCHKLTRLRDGTIITGTGGWDSLTTFREWYANGPKSERPRLGDSFEAFVIKPNGASYWYGIAALPTRLNIGKFHALGSGYQIAMGAMAAGASAIEAVKIACKLDSGTEAPVRHIKFK